MLLPLLLHRTRPAAAEAGGAAALPLVLEWQAPDGCPGAAGVKAQIARLSRTPPVQGRRLRAAARVERTDGGAWRVTLRTFPGGDTPEDSRELVGDSCDAVAGSVAVVLALRLDSWESTSPPEAQPPAPVAPDVAPPPPPAERRRGFGLGAGIAADTGALPAATLGGALHVAFRHGVTHASLQGAYWWPRDLDLGAPREGTFGFWSVGVAGCHALVQPGSRVELGPCLAVEAGALSAESSGVRVPGRTREAWLAARAGGRLSVGLGPRASLWLTVDGVVPLRRPWFVVEGLETMHRPAAVSARGTLGAEWWF